jgi:hypothetical protein
VHETPATGPTLYRRAMSTGARQSRSALPRVLATHRCSACGGPCPLLGAGQSHAELPRAALALGEARLRRFACRNTRPAARHVPLSANADPVRPRMSNATWFEAVVRWLGGGRLDQRTASGRTSGIHCPHCFIAVSVAKPTARNMLPPSVASTRRFSRSTSAALNRLVPASTSSP